MQQLGYFDEWLQATAQNEAGPEVAFSSCYPYVDDHLLVAPPKHLWPPPPSPKVRWRAARYAPLSVVQSLLAGEAISEEKWMADSESECLVPIERGVARIPFRRVLRSAAVVDRLTGASDIHRTAGLEFTRGAGMWLAASFANDQAQVKWEGPVSGALRLLADSGIGGERSRGWGRAHEAEISRGALNQILNIRVPDYAVESETAYWLLSLFHPSGRDSIDWQRGNYSLVARGGRIESPSQGGTEKRTVRMIEEGSVLFSGGPPSGAARDVAPDGFPHPVFRAGFALALPIAVRAAS
jgi:CRISPR type III-A-associated RAMP protein Csm4